MGKIFWLVSYPKSGNTWVRALLSNYRNGTAAPVSINELDGNPWTLRRHFDAWLGLSSSDLRPEEIQAYRPDFHRALAASLSENNLVKVHDAFTVNRDGDALFPHDITAGVIYIARNPLDVCTSYAHHDNVPIDLTIARMNDPEHWLLPSADGLRLNLAQYLSSWSGHVHSWLGGCYCPLKLITYEQLSADTMGTLRELVVFMDWPLDEGRLQKAVAQASFKALQAQENTSGFLERPPNIQRFFRRGLVGDGGGSLSKAQQSRLVQAHQQMMQRLSFLPSSFKITIA